jgi:protein-S-isoprenylcysteine O-methyltransferase Ste14
MGVTLVLQLVVVLGFMAGLLFGLSGDWTWPGAWILLASLALGGVSMSVWLMCRDRSLLRERMGQGNRDKPLFDRILLPLANGVLFAWIVLMALDIRIHGPAQMPLLLNFAGGGVILLSFALVLSVLRENTFATSYVRTQPERGQKVITTGPYRFVRHPMYSAAVLAYLAIPFTLGSVAGLWGIALPVLILAVRIVFEEAVLRRALPGYDAYATKVCYRLVPFVW